MNKKALYWLCNTGGWFLYVLIYALLSTSPAFKTENASLWFVIFFFGLFFSHLYRFLIVRFGWLSINIFKAIPRLVLTSTILSSLLGIITIAVQVQLLLRTDSQIKIPDTIHLQTETVLSTIVSYLLIFILWTLIYFAVHYFLNYKKAEIENLRWQASITEIELNKLKSQLNPHFVFNCMNSIRALVDHEPRKAKDAVTQLSNILRNTLMMGRNKLVPFSEELKIVEDYIALESIRLEERLKIEIAIPPDCLNFEVPPLMLQTLVENGIKHGISQLANGGLLVIQAKLLNDMLCIIVKNSGQYKGNTDSETGFGIRNTLQRLSLLYDGRATFSIQNQDQESVITQLIIPHKQ